MPTVGGSLAGISGFEYQLKPESVIQAVCGVLSPSEFLLHDLHDQAGASGSMSSIWIWHPHPFLLVLLHSPIESFVSIMGRCLKKGKVTR